MRSTESPSERELEAWARLAWRPAWSLRNRQGSIALMRAWWRHRRVVQNRRKDEMRRSAREERR